MVAVHAPGLIYAELLSLDRLLLHAAQQPDDQQAAAPVCELAAEHGDARVEPAASRRIAGSLRAARSGTSSTTAALVRCNTIRTGDLDEYAPRLGRSVTEGEATHTVRTINFVFPTDGVAKATRAAVGARAGVNFYYLGPSNAMVSLP